MMGDRSESSLLDAVLRRAQALETADVGGLLDLLHPDLRWTSHRGEVLDRDAYVRANTGGAIRWLRQSVGEVTATVVDATGAITATVTDEIARDGIEHTYRMPVTQAWVHVDGRWQCLAGHAGPLL